ncbi:hypothetical protein WICPIJ_000962, partial [Wickerhamomyces pijperi]
MRIKLPFSLGPVQKVNHHDDNADIDIQYGPNNTRFTIENEDMLHFIYATRALTPLTTSNNDKHSASSSGLYNFYWFINKIGTKIVREVDLNNLFLLNSSYNQEEFSKIQTKEQCEKMVVNSSFFIRILFGNILKRLKVDKYSSLGTTILLIEVIKESEDIEQIHISYLLLNYMMVINRYELNKDQNVHVELRYSHGEICWLSQNIKDSITRIRNRQVCLSSDQATNGQYVLLKESELDNRKLLYLQLIFHQLCSPEHQHQPYFRDPMLLVVFSIETTMVH